MKHLSIYSLILMISLSFTGCMNSSTTEGIAQKTDTEKTIRVLVPKVTLNEGEAVDVTAVLQTAQEGETTLIWEVLSPLGRMENETGAFTILSGGDRGDFTLKLKDNTTYDGEAAVRVRIRDQAGVWSPVEFSLGLNDNDPMPFVFVGDAEAVRGSRISVPVTLSTPSSINTDVEWTTVDATAISGRDYVGAVGRLVIPAGETTGTIQVTSLAQAQDSTFVVQLTSASSARIADGTATVHIQGGSALDTSVTFRTSMTRIDESASRAVVAVDITRAIASDVTVSFRIVGAAKPNVDYTVPVLQVTIPAGQTSATIAVDIADDALYERAEDITLELTNATNAGFGDITRHTIVIQDNDPMPTLSVFDSQGTEGGTLSFNVALSEVSGVDTTFSFKTVAGMATGADYVDVAGTVMIPEGSTVATVQVQSQEDSLFETTEDFSLLLTAAAGASLQRASAKGNIVDNDTMPSLQFSSASQTIAANQSSVTVTVQLSTTSGALTSVPFGISGDAIGGIDHNLVPSVISIPAGQTSANVTFSVFRHGPPTKQVILTLGSPSNAVLGGTTRHTVSF